MLSSVAVKALGRMTVAQSVLKNLFVAAALFATFRYIAEFSLLQATILAVLGFAVYFTVHDVYRTLKTPWFVEQNFQPFWISIRPNWQALLLDFGLVKDEEEYRQVWERMRNRLDFDGNRDEEGAPSRPAFNLLRDAIVLTFLKPAIPKSSCLTGGLRMIQSRRRSCGQRSRACRGEPSRIRMGTDNVSGYSGTTNRVPGTS